MTTLAQLRLLQMASQALPIGGFSHSHGLEAAIEAGLVHDEASVQQWISDVLTFSLGSYEVPQLEDMLAAWNGHDADPLDRTERLARLNDEFMASRETAELRAATVQMGYSMRVLLCALPDVPDGVRETLKRMPEISLPCVWAAAASAWSIGCSEAVTGYLWSWAENQVLAAIKTVPIGQSAGQRVLLAVGFEIARLVESRHRTTDGGGPSPGEGLSPAEGPSPGEGLSLRDGLRPMEAGEAGARSNFAPGLAILSSRHETQYSRLFRS